ncbi:hypothetical protein L7F22_057932 [Adiantum nelumboides]|nr:hypothetical protein [Adiantum nelumboides]
MLCLWKMLSPFFLAKWTCATSSPSVEEAQDLGIGNVKKLILGDEKAVLERLWNNAGTGNLVWGQVLCRLTLGSRGRGQGMQDMGEGLDFLTELKKSLYGLKQAPREWYQKFDTFMRSQGYMRSETDHCLYTKRMADGSLQILILYVDDMLIVGKDKHNVDALKGKLSDTFDMKDLGNASHILGMRIIRDKSQGLLYLSQQTYVEKVLKRFKMERGKVQINMASHPLSIKASPAVAATSCTSPASINGKHYYSLRSSYIAENAVAKCENHEDSRDDPKLLNIHDLCLTSGINEEISSALSSNAKKEVLNYSSGAEQMEIKSSSSSKDGDDTNCLPDPYGNATANATSGINTAVPAEVVSAVPGKMRMRRKKFLGVRQRPSGRWVAEIKDTTQKIRMWLGTFDTAEEAARAYDEAACLLRGSNTRTNFLPSPGLSPSSSSPLASRLAQLLQIRRSQGSVPGSPEPPASATATAHAQPTNHSSPSMVASSPLNPLMPPPFRGSNQAHQGGPGRHFPNRFLNHPFRGSASKYNSHNHHFHHKHHQSLQHFSHRKSLLNLGYSLHHLYSHAEAQPRFVKPWTNSEPSKPKDSPPWRPHSIPESESSDSNPSSPQTDFHGNFLPRRHHFDAGCQVMTRHDCVDFRNSGPCGHLAFESISPNLSGDNLSSTYLHETCQQMDIDDHSQIFARDKHLINPEDIDDLARDEHLIKSSHYHQTYSGSCSFMNALLGFNDDVLLDPSDQMNSIAPLYGHDSSFANFNVYSNSLGTSLMHVDDFPLMSELSGKLEEAESSHSYDIKCNEEASNQSSSSTSTSNMDSNGHNINDEKAELNEAIKNGDLEMKRLQFERRASPSLDALIGVQDQMLMKQNSMSMLVNSSDILAGNVIATSSQNFLSTSPSYINLLSPRQSSLGSSLSMSNNGDETTRTDANVFSEANLKSAASTMPSSSSSPCDKNMASNKSTLSFSSDTTNDGITASSISSNSSDAQSQHEAAMWNSWDLAPLCTLVA